MTKLIGNVERGRRREVSGVEPKLPSRENLQRDAISAASQIEEARQKYMREMALSGNLGRNGDEFIVMFTETLASWLHFGWQGDVMVQVAVIKRETGQVCWRGTIAPNALGREVCRRVADESGQPYMAVPVGERMLDVLVILTPKDKAEPAWATTITSSSKLRQVAELLAREAYKAKVVEEIKAKELLA